MARITRRTKKSSNKVVTKEDTNVVVKDVDSILINEEVNEALKKIKEYCKNTREQGCEKCMYSTVILMESTGVQYPFCNLKGKRPLDYKIEE